jgi:hypothetical protein
MSTALPAKNGLGLKYMPGTNTEVDFEEAST